MRKRGASRGEEEPAVERALEEVAAEDEDGGRGGGREAPEDHGTSSIEPGTEQSDEHVSEKDAET